MFVKINGTFRIKGQWAIKFLCLLVFSSQMLDGFSQAISIKEEIQMIDTYSFSAPNPVPILTDNTKIYPYFKFNGYENKAKKKAWKVVTLENEYIKIFVLPEVGGKIWGAIEKETGEEFLYKNEVIKFRNIAMRGPWTSGGIEFNFGIIGHSPATATPVDYIVKENNDGSVSCIVGTLDLTSRTRWTVEINLQKDKAYFKTKSSWYNATPLNQSYYNWMTAAAEAKEDLEFFIPGNKYLEHNGNANPWPIDEEERNLSYYKNNNFGPHKSFHIVGDYKDFFGGYYHKSKFGFGHVSAYEEMPGQKLWLWSQSRNGGIWEDLLTDHDGQYIEFQAGRLFNQYSPGKINPISQANFEPYVMDRWEELWFPYKEIGGMVDASEYGVLNVEIENGELFLGINALQEMEEKLTVLAGGKEIFTANLNLSPMQVFSKKTEVNSNDDIEVFVGDRKLYYVSNPNAAIIERPFESDEDLKAGEKQKLYTDGWESMKFREYDEAFVKLTELIDQDPSHQDALAKLAELEYRRTNYTVALEYAIRLLQLDTYNPNGNYMAGIIYRAQKNYINALEAFGWAARDMKYRSVSYAQMSEIYLLKKHYTESKRYALKSLDFNTYNVNARQVMILLARKRNNKEDFKKQIDELLIIDPLNHFAAFEIYLFDGIKEELNEMMGLVQNEFSEETILELALQYQSLGLVDAAVNALKYKESYTKIKLWLAYLLRNTDTEKSNRYLQDAIKNDPDFVFPYRVETIPVLQWGLTRTKNWKLEYYLAQNYMAVGKNSVGAEIIESLGDKPDSGTFYRFRAMILKNQIYDNRLKDYKRALQFSEGDWKVWNELSQFYLTNKKYEEAYKIATRSFKKFPGNNDIGLNYANTLLMVEKYDKSIDVLSNIEVLPSEMGAQSRIIYYYAHVLWGNELMLRHNFKKAVEVLEESKMWPQNLGVGKPYSIDSRMEDYMLAICYGELKQEDKKVELLDIIIEKSNGSIQVSSVNHLFGLLSLKNLNKEEDASKLLMQLENAAQKNDLENGTTLAIAFYKNDKDKLTELKDQEIITDGIWNIIETLMKD